MKRKTVKADALVRMSAVNSRRMPTVVEQHGRRLEWVGIGWIDVGRASGREVHVVCQRRGCKEHGRQRRAD